MRTFCCRIARDLRGEPRYHDASPTARALLALELVQGSPGITADRLADSLGVSERAARRYMAVLREAGIPVESLRGRCGGYRAGRGLRLPPLMFSGAEALGLVMAVLDGHHDPDDPTDPVGSALGKIMRVLPASVAAQAEAVRRTVPPAPDRATARWPWPGRWPGRGARPCC
ncbi:helix-turn-helix transcriptional regulator [Cellulomonas hominis]